MAKATSDAGPENSRDNGDVSGRLDLDKNANSCESISGEVWVVASKSCDGRYHPIHLCANQSSARRLGDQGSQIYGRVPYGELINAALRRYLRG